jgi:hypothetical protein
MWETLDIGTTRCCRIMRGCGVDKCGVIGGDASQSTPEVHPSPSLLALLLFIAVEPAHIDDAHPSKLRQQSLTH